MPHLIFLEIFGIRKLEFLGYRAALFASFYLLPFHYNTDL